MSPPDTNSPAPGPSHPVKRPVWLVVLLLGLSAFFALSGWIVHCSMVRRPEEVTAADWLSLFGSAAACVSWAFVAVTLLLARSERAIALLAWPWWILKTVAVAASIVTGVATFFL